MQENSMCMDLLYYGYMKLLKNLLFKENKLNIHNMHITK